MKTFREYAQKVSVLIAERDRTLAETVKLEMRTKDLDDGILEIKRCFEVAVDQTTPQRVYRVAGDLVVVVAHSAGELPRISVLPLEE